MNTQFVRTDVSDKMIAGVCGGLARFFGVDSTIMRLIFVLAVISGVSPLIYVILWIVMPREQKLSSTPTQLPNTTEPYRYDPYTGERIN